MEAMIILVPEHLCDELLGPAREAAPEAELRPYGENEATPDGLDEAVAVLRWVAGKEFARMVHQGPQVRWLHTASAGVDHVLTPDVRAKAGLTVTELGAGLRDRHLRVRPGLDAARRARPARADGEPA